MQIGKTLRTYMIEPLVDPIPQRRPAPAVRPRVREPEPVSAGSVSGVAVGPVWEMPVLARWLGL